MNSIWRSLGYLKNYSSRVILNIFLTILVAFFEVISLLSVIPFLQIIFNTGSSDIVYEKPEKFKLLPISEVGDLAKANYNYWGQQIIEQYDKQQVLLWICIFVFFVFFIKNLLTYFNSLISKNIQFSVSKNIRDRVYDKILYLPTGFYTDQSRGDILNRFSNDTLKFEQSVLAGYSLIFKEPVMILFYIISLLLISAKLTLFIIVLLPILGFVIGQISKSLKRTSTKAQEQSSRLVSLIDETMHGLKIIKSFTAEAFFRSRFKTMNDGLFRQEEKIAKRRMAASPVSEFMGIGVVMIVLWYGGNLVLEGFGSGLTGELLIGYLILFARLITPLKAFSNQYSMLSQGLASADRIEDFLALKNPIKDQKASIEKTTFNSKIDLENVYFSYPNSPAEVLKGINISLAKGKTLALVGQSGAGKSTIAELLPRFYDVTKGKILIDGQDIRDIALNALRSMISYVTQESVLFHDSIEANIRFGNEEATQEEVIQAAKAANAHSFISGFEAGYLTNVGERGAKLSGGQKQRITIARAILKNAPILILDEATSALDTESERLVQDAINKLLKNRTALVIAHRLSTIKNSDKICVMDQGKIVESGTHDELILQENGVYKALTELQNV